jgi:transcriptional regulator with XRE-family HTH domain
MNERPTGPGTAMANFLIEELPTLGLTNDEIASKLGYARPNIVSMWKAGKTKVTIDHVFALAELTKVDPAYVMGLFIDQYVSDWSGVDRFKDIISMLQRLCTEEEFEIIQIVREARKGNSLPLDANQRTALKDLFAVPITTPEGPLKPVDSLAGLGEPGERRKFARRGFHRDLTISEIDEIRSKMADTGEELAKSAEAEKKVRKRPATKAKREPETNGA